MFTSYRLIFVLIFLFTAVSSSATENSNLFIAVLNSIEKNSDSITGILNSSKESSKFFTEDSNSTIENSDLKDNPEFLEWQKALGQDSVELVYSGPYNGNPASLFGHLFLKFTNKNNLLSYTVAFMANTEDDPDVITIWKGLTGGYNAGFSINPYYINTALYNNSESRDLWEFPLLLTKTEIAKLQERIWQINNNPPENYLFFTRNCAFKILELFDELKPELNLKTQANLLIIPLDIVKILAENGLINHKTIYQRKSIRKHLDENLQSFSTEQNRQYRMAKADVNKLESINDVLVLDTLIDRWKYRNYKKKLQMTEVEHLAFEKTLSRRAQLNETSPLTLSPISDTQIVHTEKSPHLSHKTSWIRGGVGTQQESGASLKVNPDVSYRLGVHGLTSSSLGLSGHSYMEYLGIDCCTPFKILPFSIYNLDKFYWAEPQFSWKLNSILQSVQLSQKSKNFFLNNEFLVQLECGVGISDRNLFLLVGPSLFKNGTKVQQEWMLLPQIDFGWRYEVSDFVLLGQYKKTFISNSYHNSLVKAEYFNEETESISPWLAFSENSWFISFTQKLSPQREWITQAQIEDRRISFTSGLQLYY